MKIVTTLALVVIIVYGTLMAASVNKASVTIHAVDTVGMALGPITVVRFVDLKQPSKNLDQRFSGGSAVGIPYGDYVASLHTPSHNVAGSVRVNQKQVFVVLTARGDVADGPNLNSKVDGEIIGRTSDAQLWVKVVRAYSEDYGCCTISPVLPDGHFTLSPQETGDYICIVNGPSGVLLTKLLRIIHKPAQVEIDLKRDSLTVK